MRNEPEQRSSERKRFNLPLIIGGGVILAAAVAVGLCLMTGSQKTASAAADEAFDIALRENSSKTYDRFYSAAFDYAEERSHTANDVTISVDNLRETAELEVLEVGASDVREYTFANEFTRPVSFLNDLVKGVFGDDARTLGETNAVVWLEGSCKGIYAVDLNASEIIVDNENHYVMIRIPAPTLTFTSPRFEVKYFNNGTTLSKVFDGSVQTGLDAAISDTADMTARLHDTLNENRGYRETARSSAETLIVNLVKGINPDIPDLKVEVSFFN